MVDAQKSSDFYPRAILHFDGDAFFASVEQAKDWRLRGKPVITGGERGAATSLSYEAKARGLHRGMSLREIKRRCPDAVIVASDYTAYSIYARRMYAIVREFAPVVEEYSIDECFADITGLNMLLEKSYEDISRSIKEKLECSLGITFGVGLAPNKTLAKTASKMNKPAGFTPLPPSRRKELLERVSIYDVWGLGGVTGSRLHGLGVHTAYDFSEKPEGWLRDNGFVKPQRDTWLELQGHAILSLEGKRRSKVGSIMSTRTFTPPSTDRAYIFAQLSKNVEMVCAKARRIGVKAHALSFYLKTQEFTYHGVQTDLPTPLGTPAEMLELIESRFDEVYATDMPYRASGITLRSLVTENAETPDLFGESVLRSRSVTTFSAVDSINAKYGRSTIFVGSSMKALTSSEQGYRTQRRDSFLHAGPAQKKSLDIPFLGVARV